MDVLSDICRSIRLQGSIFYFSELSAPWGITLPTASEPRFHVVLEGGLWYQTDAMDKPERMETGDVLVIPEGGWHWIADTPQSKRVPSADVAQAKQKGQPLFQGDALATRLLCGLFRFDKHVEHPMMSALPSRIQLRHNATRNYTWLTQTAAWMFEELSGEQPGAEILVDRLCEVLFIQALRTHQRLQDCPTGFLAALNDPKISKALTLLHRQPEADWTIEKMGRAIGMSRAVFADRFNLLVGQPFKAYLTAWRMFKAVNLLRTRSATLSSVATAVGYSSDIAFSRAFRRFFDTTPQNYRKRLAA